MNERIIELTEINPKDFFGTQNSTIAQLKRYFPKIKIVARGAKLKIYGEAEILDEFEVRFNRLIKYYHRYNNFTYTRVYENRDIEKCKGATVSKELKVVELVS